ncbi:MAG: hypothetical protein ACXWW4_16935, partial [Candidatus Binatia bacterium]
MGKSFHHEAPSADAAATEKKNGRKERKGRKKRIGSRRGGFETRPLGFGASTNLPKPRKLSRIVVRRTRRVRKIITPNFVLFVSFVVRLDFIIEHGNLGVPVRKICASHAIFELLQCKTHKKDGAQHAESCGRG